MINSPVKTTPLCPYFGECGGCQHQDLPYDEELKLKEQMLRDLFEDMEEEIPFRSIVPSPREYHYRSRLDMNLLRIRSGEVFVGFAPTRRGLKVMEVEACPLAMEPLSDFIPRLQKEATAKLTPKYRVASLVVKTGDDGRVFWGGIGKRSLQMAEEDYLFTDLCGRRIFYALDTFFQANLSILPRLMQTIVDLGVLSQKKRFYDLYGGVGLFGLCLADHAQEIVLVEENVHAVKLARHNVSYNKLENFTFYQGRMENLFADVLTQADTPAVAMIDPPRKGMSGESCTALAACRNFSDLLYLSCNPEALVRDLMVFHQEGWTLRAVIPFDFFPKTRHLETLVWLSR